MFIRHATLSDIDEIMEIYSHAQKFMADNNNPNQWGSVYPPRQLIENDIDSMYVCMENDFIACVFYYAQENDPTYDVIYEGSWQNDLPYGVVHRIASSHITKGAARFCLNWAYEKCKNLRIDTHKDNIPMQNLLNSLGFKYCGIIHCDHTGDERMAFQKNLL
ncbi:MAG: GNAT family N-acetyltransferase [Clostridia bacterium]